MYKIFKKGITLFLVTVIITSLFSVIRLLNFNALADTDDLTTEYRYKNLAKNDVVVNAVDYFEFEEANIKTESNYKNKENVLIWENGNGTISWEFNISEEGLYNFAIEYLPLKNSSDLELKLLIDGKYPFDGAEKLMFSRDWKNATDDPRIDSDGNEITPEQVETGLFVYRLATDYTGVEIEPYKIEMSEGKHNITLVGKGYSIAISQITLTAPEKVENYDVISKNYDLGKNNEVKSILIQGEDATIKSDNVLIPKADLGNAYMSPADPYNSKLNFIGGTNWQDPGQSLTWEFDVAVSGYYYFATRYKQNELVNGESWRWLKIDGKTPFTECKELRFPYGTGWKYYEFSNRTTRYYFWLEEGKHTVSLEVTLGELSNYYYRLSNVIDILSDLYLQIVMITGETPDINRDYELFNQIPSFNEKLKGIEENLDSMVNDMKSLTGKQGSQYTSAINSMKRVIKKMVEAPYIAHIYVKDFYTNYTTLSSWLNEMKKMPLSIDEIQFVYAGNDVKKKDTNLFESLLFGLKRLLISYTDEYSDVNASKDTTTLKLWVNWGRDQTMALDSLIRDSFTAEKGINVDVQIVNNSLINGLLANNFPDIQLQLTRTDPVNFGMRGALLDLTQFDDCELVLKRFQKDAELPYRYNNALYALPDQQTYYCMFYRTDVFEKLKINVPKTWDEFLECATVIQRYNMGVYVPYTQITTTTTVNAGIGSLNLYPTLMVQNNLSLYNDKLNSTKLDTENAIKVFEEWTEMYSDYGYLKEADFYNRFRNGSMPLGIAPYTTYMMFYSAAPEIQDRWTITNVPSSNKGNNYVVGGGTGCAIVKETSHPHEAWEFLKWWTSAETQMRYSQNVESMLGMLGRIPTSNVEAFKNLSWNPKDLNTLISQWDCVKELEEVPGSYYLSRAVDQAFWSVINDDISPKDAITKWSKVANKEIERKIKEYS